MVTQQRPPLAQRSPGCADRTRRLRRAMRGADLTREADDSLQRVIHYLAFYLGDGEVEQLVWLIEMARVAERQTIIHDIAKKGGDHHAAPVAEGHRV